MTAPILPDPERVLVSLAERKVALELGTVDLCFVAMLYVRAQGGVLASFDEDQLLAIFEDVCERVEPSAEQRRKRATHAIQRLRDQRLLARVDGTGLLRSGEYALTRLASGIVEFFLNDDALTRESLTLLTASLRSSLTQVREAARHASSPESWHANVLGPLQVTVGDLAAGIERRQRGLDLQQERFQKEIAELLAADWFGAIERCQALLDETSATLRELAEVLLSDTHRLQGLLHDIEEAALARGNLETEHAVQRVMEQLDRIAAWGSARQRAWSEYYQYVHRYLRDVVRLDPSRALSERLREQLAGRLGRAFALTVAHAPPIQLLRDVVAPPERPPIKRPREKREEQPGDAPGEDPRALVESRVRDALDEGLRSLSEVTDRVTRDVAETEHFLTAGRVAEVVARLAKTHAELERPWHPVRSGMLVEEWQVARAGGDDE